MGSFLVISNRNYAEFANLRNRFRNPYAELVMADRLYYHDSFICNFDAEIRSIIETPRPAVILDRTGFYPTSGGQIHDTGSIEPIGAPESISKTKLRVVEVAENEDGEVVHYLEAPLKDLSPGTRVRGEIDVARRHDHMRQHSAQHVLSAAFVRLYNIPTVSFHMAADYCSIDLDTPSLSKEQTETAESTANGIVLENRPVEIRFVSRDETAELGLRKIPTAERDELRLIDIRDFDLTACGGTHVNQTGQIGAILLRKTERVRQGYRVEFVAGQRAVAAARHDFMTLTETASLFSANIYDVPQQTRKALDEIKSLHKQCEQTQEDLASAEATALLAEVPETQGRTLIVRTFSDRDIGFLKLLAQKLTRRSRRVIALLASHSQQPTLIFAQSKGEPHDMGSLLKETVGKLGGRGGGSKDLAQGGFTNVEGLPAALEAAAEKIRYASV